MTKIGDASEVARTRAPGAAGHRPGLPLPAGQGGSPAALGTETRIMPRPTLSPDDLKNRALWQTTSDMVFIVRRDGVVLSFHAPPELEYPLSVEKLAGRRLMELLPTALAQQAQYYVEKALRTGSMQSVSGQLQLPGKLRTFQVRLTPCGEGEVLATVHDATDRAQMEKELLEISHREQMRIGQDLHDGLGQHLTGITFLTRALEKKLAAQGLPEAAEVAEVSRLVMQALSQTRSLARGLFPVALESKGLIAAFRELATTVEEVFGVACMLDCDESVSIRDQIVATHLFRLAQEAVSNAVRHGKAKNVVIEFKRAGDYLALAVHDDGVGLPKEGPKAQGLGLKIMQYRAQKVGGVLNLQPGERGGTVVTCLFAHPPAASATPDAE
jgi:PAS domain S-box-containing protein